MAKDEVKVKKEQVKELPSLLSLGRLKKATREGLRLALVSIGSLEEVDDLRTWVEPRDLAWWFFLLREVEDKPEFFPHGKWATLQEVELLLIAAAGDTEIVER